MINTVKFGEYSRNCYNDANCEYDGKNYFDTHILMVVDIICRFEKVFNNPNDFIITKKAGYGHDLIEDAKITYNNIKDNSNKDVADVILAVTDVPAETRLLRHLLTMPKTIKDHRAIILKMSDIYGNAQYSKSTDSSMYKKYASEYLYRRPIFQMALKSFSYELNQEMLATMWNELDNIHNYKW